MTWNAPKPQLAREEPGAGALDTIRCPNGCGDYLSFRSEPMTGVTQQRCWRCGTPWTAVPIKKPMSTRAERKVFQRGELSALLAALLPSPHDPGVTVVVIREGIIAAGFSITEKGLATALGRLRRVGRALCERQGAGERQLWRRSATWHVTTDTPSHSTGVAA